MGCVLSSPSTDAASAGTSPTTANASDEYASELNSYEAACRRDPEISSFDSALRERTSHAISALAGGSLEVHALSFETLQVVTGCLLDMNQEVVRIVLDRKRDVWSSPELYQLVEDYFDSSLQTLDFCAELEHCLGKARDSQIFLRAALQHFAEEEAAAGGEGRRRYERTLEEMRHFKSAGDPFTEEFFRAFHSVYAQQASMLQKLHLRKTGIGKKIKTVRSWRKLSSVIFVSAFAAVLICSVVAAVMAAPPVAAALAAAAAIPLGSMGKCVDSLWKKYSDTLKGQKVDFSTMYAGAYVAIKDQDSLRILVDRLEVQIGSLLGRVDFALKDEEPVKYAMEEIKKKLEAFMKSVEDLDVQADQCSRNIRRAREAVLQGFIKPPQL
ncbi:uncharacterized protein M6B38_296970 [Iris pallida]|uniref:Uncharacterized protein n=1 Tax=Iris pallida TaxID=29817 RepID=A0AAX6HSG6_IRIPA|nr:uncharacterized protein M6B38_296970 [Iris pallida]